MWERKKVSAEAAEFFVAREYKSATVAKWPQMFIAQFIQYFRSLQAGADNAHCSGKLGNFVFFLKNGQPSINWV